MARKPETTAAHQVNILLPKSVYFEKQNNPYRGGTPDFYYEGKSDILWIEYKWFKYRPLSWEVIKDEKRGLSRLQQNWLRRAFRNGVMVAVVAKHPKGYALFIGDDWETAEPSSENLKAIDVAKWIESEVSNASRSNCPSG